MSRRLNGLGAVVLVLASCGGGGGAAAPPSANVTPPPTSASTTTVARTPEQQVEAAYLKSWDVYARAMRTLDTTGIEVAYAQVALGDLRNEVEAARRAHTPARIQVEHSYHVQVLESALAVVVDRYVNHSVYVNPATGRPTELDPSKTLTDIYTLKKIEDAWKVISIKR